MALRILPFRQYDEHDVINMFALESAYVNESTTGTSFGDAGVFVTVATGNLNLDTITYDSTYGSYLGNTNYPFVGSNQYPRVSLSVRPAASGDTLIGMTLRQTARTDENGEKLLYYPQKAEELMAVLPGQAVPVATRGIFALAASTALDGSLAIGTGLKLSTTSGKLTGCALSDSARVATVIATGSRVAGGTADQFAGSAGSTGTYAIVGLGL
jgi:hypothetical protein